ncbi:hypothetical protein [Serratia phage BUCT660]|nr:hypothetical protein [Serratia phage BUCT660]
MLRSKILARSAVSNESFLDSLRAKKEPETKTLLTIPEKTIEATGYLEKHKNDVENKLGSAEWVAEHSDISTINPLWSLVLLNGELPENIGKALTDNFKEAIDYAKEGAKVLEARSKEIRGIEKKLDEDYQADKIENASAAIQSAYSDIKCPLEDLKFDKPMLGGFEVEMDGTKRKYKFHDGKVTLEELPAAQDIAKAVKVAFGIVEEGMKFLNEWDDYKLFDVPGIDTSEGIWRDQSVKHNNKKTREISDFIDSEGHVEVAELFYVSPLRAAIDSAVAFIRLVNDSSKK